VGFFIFFRRNRLPKAASHRFVHRDSASEIDCTKNMKIIVTGLIATYPLGGVSWDYIQYVKGLSLLGHEVFYLEDAGKWGDSSEEQGKWVYNPRLGTFTEECAFNLHYLQEVLASIGPQMIGHWAFRTPQGEYFGLTEREIEQICMQADLLLNISGCCLLRERYQGCRSKVYVDTDPLYTQFKLAAVHRGTATADQAYSVDSILKHDCFFSFGENIGAPSCRIPDCGLNWHTTRQPIVLRDWPFTYVPRAAAFTTVMSWTNEDMLPAFDGEIYGGKNVEFMKFMNLPSGVSAPLEIALSGPAPVDRLRQHGWQVVDGYQKSSTMNAYRNYLGGSRGEWSIAKNVYVASRSGWFSTRSAAYLALGKPVVVQDTGFSRYLPTGSGLFAFTTFDEAVSAIDHIQSNYRIHCEAARAIAEEHFRSEKVLARLLDDAGL
jgi:hypothetical protein